MTDTDTQANGVAILAQPINTSVCLSCKLRKPDASIDADTQVCNDCSTKPQTRKRSNAKPKPKASPVVVTKMAVQYVDMPAESAKAYPDGPSYLIYRTVTDGESLYLGWCWQSAGTWYMATGKGGRLIWQGGPYRTRQEGTEALEAWLALPNETMELPPL